MKKKIISSVMITVLFAVTIVMIFFMALYNVQEINKTRNSLRDFNDFVLSVGIDDERIFEHYKIDGVEVRTTILDSNCDVLYDSFDWNLENHSDREEIKLALSNGEGYSSRVSDTTDEKMMYYATKGLDGIIIRSSVPFGTLQFFRQNTIKYCLGIIIFSMIFSSLLSMKLVKIIIEPLKDLEIVTRKIAKGDLHIRVKTNSNDEIGTLGNTFNNMADQLQGKINEIVDKQNSLESILKSMESGVIAVNSEDKVITINPYAKRIFGIRRDITGEIISNYIKDYDINKFLLEKDDVEKEIKIFTPIERDIRIKKASLINGIQNVGKVIVVQDISDIKRLENMRSQFVANVSHELKTPLTSIKGFAETLLYVEDNETRNKFLKIIDKEAERLSRLINDILVLSRIESQVVGEEEEFLPKIIINDVINVLRKNADDKDIKVTLEEDNDDLLFGEKDKFLQLVLNLVENAIKYSPNGSLVKIKSYSDNGYYFFEVEDNGIGIPEEDLPRIFERFYRVDKARKSGGTGLGLAIVKYIVKGFNGDIFVDSKFGEGTKFKVKIKHIL